VLKKHDFGDMKWSFLRQEIHVRSRTKNVRFRTDLKFNFL
jgi:hypothetical protein